MMSYNLDIRRPGPLLNYFHNEANESRRARLAIGIPYEILLAMLTNGFSNGQQAADFFLSLSEQYFEPTAAYLSGFFIRLCTELDFNSCELDVRPEFGFHPMDFGRPSPTRLIVWDFAERLAKSPRLFQALNQIPGADLVFRNVSRDNRDA